MTTNPTHQQPWTASQPTYEQPNYTQRQAIPYVPVTPAGVVASPVTPTSPLAVASLICSIAGFITFGLASIAAVICGHMAWKDTASGKAAGHGMTITGLILGYIPIAGWAAFWFLVVLGATTSGTTGP